MSIVATGVSVRAAYRVWADTYDAETVVSALDEQAVTALTPARAGTRLLDAACGTGRRMRGADTSTTGIDLVFEMLAAGRREENLRVANADLRELPFAAETFDVVWCRLALGHLADVRSGYRDLARVLAKGGSLIISDLHPVAARAGHTRSFRAGAAVYSVEHHIHDIETHVDAAASALLACDERLELQVGPAVRSFYASSPIAYEEQLGLPLLLAMRFVK